MSIILAIESSCDETAAAIIEDGNQIISNIVATQIDVHKKYGGVIPEVASRIHVENITAVIEECLSEANLSVEDMDAIAVTQGPGLVGSLHVGIQAAKALAWAYDKPLVPVHHIAGHIYANALVSELEFPLMALVVSGGHTEIVLMSDAWSFEVIGTTQDDAIGEAFDKVGRVLGLPYPGGVYIDKLSKEGKNIYTLPKPKTEKELDFSFSGLKSGVLQFIDRKKRNNEPFLAADLARSFQETAIDCLIQRVEKALELHQVKMLVVAGGVAANSCLRERIPQLIEDKFPKVKVIVPPLYCCTDNAAMIGVAGSVAYDEGVRASWDLSANPNLKINAYSKQ